MADAEKRRTPRPTGRKPPPNPPPLKPPPLKSQPPRRPPMSEPKVSAGSVFEIDRIRRLVELMKEHDLSEVDLRESRQRIRICRGPKEPPRGAYPPPPPPAPAAIGSASAKAAVAENPNIILI